VGAIPACAAIPGRSTLVVRGGGPITVTAEPIRNLVVQLSGAVDIPVSVSYEAGAQDDGVIELILQPQHSRENVRQLSIGKFAKFTQPPKADPEPSEPRRLRMLSRTNTNYRRRQTGIQAMWPPQSLETWTFCTVNFR